MDRRIFLVSILFAFTVVFLLEGAEAANALTFDNPRVTSAPGVGMGSAGLLISILNVCANFGGTSCWVNPWAVIGIALFSVIVYMSMGFGDDPEQSDDQGDGSDVMEDEAELADAMREERRMEKVQVYCDETYPPVLGEFVKLPTKTGYEYKYSYTVRACEKSISMFVRLHGDGVIKKTEFRIIRKGQEISHSESVVSTRDYDRVCLKILGDAEPHCFSEETENFVAEEVNETEFDLSVLG